MSRIAIQAAIQDLTANTKVKLSPGNIRGRQSRPWSVPTATVTSGLLRWPRRLAATPATISSPPHDHTHDCSTEEC
jgi:hypothetical protein